MISKFRTRSYHMPLNRPKPEGAASDPIAALEVQIRAQERLQEMREELRQIRALVLARY